MSKAGELFLRKALESAKKHRKQIKLPVDLTKSGVFPQPADSLRERAEMCVFLNQYLGDIRRASMDEKVKTVLRVMRERRKKSKRTDWFKKHDSVDVGDTSWTAVPTTDGWTN